MSLSICFTKRFVRLCNELNVPLEFLKFEIEKCFGKIRKKIRAKRIYFDTHGNVKNSMYYSVSHIISLVTYSLSDMPRCNKQKYFFRDLFHELRHFQQDKIYGWNMDEYSLKDLNEGTRAYYGSKIEKDARKYEKRGEKIYCKFKKLFG